MPFSEMITLAVSIIVPLGAFIAWGWSRIDRKFDKIERKIEALDHEMREMRTSLNRMEGASMLKNAAC